MDSGPENRGNIDREGRTRKTDVRGGRERTSGRGMRGRKDVSAIGVRGRRGVNVIDSSGKIDARDKRGRTEGKGESERIGEMGCNVVGNTVFLLTTRVCVRGGT